MEALRQRELRTGSAWQGVGVAGAQGARAEKPVVWRGTFLWAPLPWRAQSELEAPSPPSFFSPFPSLLRFPCAPLPLLSLWRALSHIWSLSMILFLCLYDPLSLLAAQINEHSVASGSACDIHRIDGSQASAQSFIHVRTWVKVPSLGTKGQEADHRQKRQMCK